MNDYNLSGLSTRSFEQLVQALAVKVIGPGVTIFGDGPDGGREATFEGAMSYPTRKKGWTGYLVVQAKFKQRPQDSKADGDWALDQLRHELQTFATSDKNRRLPDYYIFATNVVLTPTLNQGSKDKAAKIFEQFSSQVPLKGYAIWDYDQIRTFLDNAKDIRRSYAAWITPGDVLSQVIEWMQPKQKDFEQILTNFLQKELQSDQYVNLEQAGHAIEDKIPIARVFIDTPAFDHSMFDPPEENAEALPPGFVSELLLTAVERLDPRSQGKTFIIGKKFGEITLQSQLGRYVLIGGPGQGKTTFAQFICQLFRTSILKDRVFGLAVESRLAMADIQTQCEKESIALPSARRFPLRIVLSEFAAALARKETNSLLSYIIDRIRKRTDQIIDVGDFRNWLGTYPWLLILDGLDEVPSSSNREEVLSSIRNFWVDASECNSDILVIATTRPQGYSQEFSPDLYRHYWLAPLSTPRALHYGQRLVEARYGTDQDRREKILSRLKTASSNEATARLMRSPLQVTIMAALVDKVGKPPQERWTLFRDYYKVIYDREVERDIPAAEILRDYKPDVDTIHHRVGLLLQIQGEKSGSTDTRLSRVRLADIIRDRLVEEEHSETEVNELQEKITKAAAERLVFLAGLESDRVGFEIRSFQEFMAAECLMDGDDKSIRERLREIAPVSYWRNVFLFAAGKCFAERQHLRDVILALCDEMNDDPDDEAFRVALMGSQLALDLLEDGPARRQPKYTQALARNALRLLDHEPSDYHRRLAELYDPGLANVYQKELQNKFAISNFKQKLGAWVCLSHLNNLEVPWAKQLVESNWPRSREEKVDLLIISSYTCLDSELFLRLVNSIPLLSPQEVARFEANLRRQSLLDSGRHQVNLTQLDAQLFAMASIVSPWSWKHVSRESPPFYFANNADHFVDASYFPVEAKLYPWRSLKQWTRVHTGWTSYVAAARFLDDPSKWTLAKELRFLADFVPHFKFDGSILPWPFAVCLDVSTSDELLKMADEVEAGDYGDIEDWNQAEKRWQTDGVNWQDLLYADEHWPFDKHIGNRGFAFGMSEVSFARLPNRDFLSSVRDLYSSIRQPRLRALLARVLVVIYGGRYITSNPDPEIRQSNLSHLRQVIDEAEAWLVPRLLLAIDKDTFFSDEGAALINHIGKTARFEYGSDNPVLAPMLARLFKEKPALTGLLQILSYIGEGDPSLIPESYLNPDLYPEELIKESVTYLRLAQKNLPSAEQVHLARSLAKLVHPQVSGLYGDSSLVRVLQAVREYRTEDGSIEPFLLELKRNLSGSSTEYQSRITDVLIQTLRLRLSRLTDPDVWSGLNLPEGLGRIVRV